MNHPSLAVVLGVSIAVSGCNHGSSETRDASDVDLTTTLDGSVDARAGDSRVEDGGASDAGGEGSTTSAEAEVVRMGTSGLILRGVVLGPSGALAGGEVFVLGNTIACVAQDCSGTPGASDATILETHGIISPGLIDSHNHLAYDIFDEWQPPMMYGDRYEWADDPSYEAFIAPYADRRSTGNTYCPCAKWGELRAIVHGTTTVMGQSFQQGCVNVFVRNPDHYDGIGYEQLSTNIASVRDINDSQAASLIGDFTASREPLLRYAVHMAEGIDTPATLEFDSFAGRDPRTNRHMGTSLLSGSGFSGTAVLIHSITLDEAQLAESAGANAKLVWSPSSNIALYGRTADIGAWIRTGVTIGLGPDWTLSGEDDMLGEMRFARDYARTSRIEALTSERIWQMATSAGAEVVGLAGSIGALVVGARADITVIGRTGGDPYAALVDADARDVRLTMIDGKGYYGDLAIEGATAVNGMCENITACGVSKFLCVEGVPATASGSTVSRTDESLEEIRTQLLTLLNGYGRSDLLELVSECRTP